MSFLTTLQTYAQKAPESLPSSILFKHSSKNITIFDGYPKSIFHFLILPRIQKPDPVLSNLGTLLNSGDKVRAKEVITSLSEDAQLVKQEILDEMDTRYGFKWDIWIGFHGAPSMEYVFFFSISSNDVWTSLPDTFIFTYFLQIFCLIKWRIKSIIIHSTQSLDFSWTFKKSLIGSMQTLPSSQILWVKLSSWTILSCSFLDAAQGQDTKANKIWTNLERTTCMFSLQCSNEEHPSSEKTPWRRMGQAWTSGKRKCSQKKEIRSKGRSHEQCKHFIASHIFKHPAYILFSKHLNLRGQCILSQKLHKVVTSMFLFNFGNLSGFFCTG